MRKLIAITSVSCGILLFLVPRYVLPACEYAGFSRMHCSDTAEAEYVVGALLVLTGFLTFLIQSAKTPLVGACLSTLLFGFSIWLPDRFGYCQSPKMPCNYGMVPGIRFFSIIGLLMMIVAVFLIARSYRKKGSS